MSASEKPGTLGTNWGEENLTWWEKRSKLEKKLIVALIVAAIVLSAFLIFYTTKPHAVNTSVCSSSACLEAASLIVTHIDTTINPCDDFFKFTCGKFIENTHGDLKATSIKEIKAQVERQMEEIINEPISDDDHDFIRRQKQLLQSCLNETAAEEEAMEVLEEHMQELNGWPVVVGYTWRERYFDWLNMIIKLKRFGYYYEMLLSFNAVVDPKNVTRNILMIDKPYSWEIKDKHKELYKTSMTEIAVALGAGRNRAVLDMEKVLDFKEKLFEIVHKNNNDKSIDDTNETRFTIEEFQEYNNEIDWLDFINTLLYPAANLTNEDYVIFPRNEFMEDFFGLIYKTPKRIQANYILWSAIELAIPFLPKKIQEIMGNYTCQTNPGKASQDRTELCNKLIMKSYAPKPSDVIYARKYLPEEKREQVQEILTNVKMEFVAALQENSWMDDESKENAVKKIESVNEVIGAPGDYFNDTIFDVFEAIFPDDLDEESGFFEKFLYYAQLQNNYLFASINNNGDESKLLFFQMTTWVNALYLVSYNSLMIPTAILQGILFDYQRPMYLNYGSVGSIIGHELTHAVAKGSENIKEDEIWTKEGAEAFKDAVNCMIESAENFDVEGTNHTINGTLTLEENIADFTGTKVSYRAYKKWVLENGEEPQLPGIEYSPEQLFWIASILHECYKLSGEKLELGLEFDLHANNAFRATGPIRNNPDFAKDFNCLVGSKMNPSEKCQIF